MSLTNKLLLPANEIDIYMLIKDVFIKLKEEKKDQDIEERHRTLITNAIQGRREARRYVKNEILFILDKYYKNITPYNIDSILEQYHVNYYINLYGEDDENEISKVFEAFMISKEETPYEIKYGKLAQIIYQENFGFYVIDELQECGLFSDIAARSINDIYIQYGTKKRKVKNLSFRSLEDYLKTINRMTAYDAKKDLSNSPILDCTLGSGSRVNISISPVTHENNQSFNIRNYLLNNISLDELIERGTINRDMKKFLEFIIKAKLNFLVVGGMGDGKSTLLKALILLKLQYDKNQWGLTIENTAELRIKETFPEACIVEAFYDDDGVTAAELIKNGMRQNLDFIINGEIREPSEAVQAIQAYVKALRGSGGSYHAWSPKAAIRNLANDLVKSGVYPLYMSALIDVCEAIDVLIFMKRDSERNIRCIRSISEIVWNDNANEASINKLYDCKNIYEYDAESGIHKRTDYQPSERFFERLELKQAEIKELKELLNSKGA